jgi:hypothetical protein
MKICVTFINIIIANVEKDDVNLIKISGERQKLDNLENVSTIYLHQRRADERTKS